MLRLLEFGGWVVVILMALFALVMMLTAGAGTLGHRPLSRDEEIAMVMQDGVSQAEAEAMVDDWERWEIERQNRSG